MTQIRMQAHELAFYEAGQEAGGGVAFGEVAKLARRMKESYVAEVTTRMAQKALEDGQAMVTNARTKADKKEAERRAKEHVEETRKVCAWMGTVMGDALERLAESMDKAQTTRQEAFAKAIAKATKLRKPNMRRRLGKIVDAVFEDA